MSNRSRCLQLGAQTVDIRHALGWKLLFLGRLAGDLLRSLVWPGRSTQRRRCCRQKKPARCSERRPQDVATDSRYGRMTLATRLTTA